MTETVHRKVRKRPYELPPDRDPFSTVLRYIGKRIAHRDYAKGLAEANQLLASGGLAPHDQSRVLALVGDSEFKRGEFGQAAEIYLRAATQSLEHHSLWLRPLIGHVRALLKDVEVEQALFMARHAADVARQKRADFDAQVRAANEQVATLGSVAVPGLPPRVSVVATRLGYLFLQEGEPAAAKEFFERAIDANPRGGCRARQGLARVALAMDEPREALRLATKSIRMGKFCDKTISSWPILIAARRKLGGWMISRNLLGGLERSAPAVRARTVLTIVREMRKSDMWQWRDLAYRWIEREGEQFPVVAAEIRKLVLASWKVTTGNATQKRLAAEQLLQTPGLSRSEWLGGAKEAVRAGLSEGREVDLESIIQSASDTFGVGFTPKVAHSLALSCIGTQRHDLARVLLQRNLTGIPASQVSWAKSAWALARMETSVANYTASAHLYRQCSETTAFPLRFRLQAKMEWAKALLKTGDPELTRASAQAMGEALASINNPELLMDFGRQLRSVDEPLAVQIFQRGQTLALSEFETATHPSRALDILFKLTRRRVLDFACAFDVIRQWEAFDEGKRLWLWSENARFWEYIGLVFYAYAAANFPEKAEALAHQYLDDPATTAEGLVHVGIPYGRWLIREQHRAVEALELFDWLIRVAPHHELCATAYYWLALDARHRGDRDREVALARCIRAVQGGHLGMLKARQFDINARLLEADLSVTSARPPAEQRDLYEECHATMLHDLALLENQS